ncbi:MAG: ACP phosphodiesterase [Fulvivirga sp.]|nr:ACP phosphodiesterase [Fulvivirga sp.]
MNFLAHLHLSGTTEEVIVGNFIGDFVKGKKYKNYPDKVAKGIMLHRAIDEYTDSHEVVEQSKNHLRKKYRHYSGVIVDMFYDHFLARNWATFHHLSLSEFTIKSYAIIDEHYDMLPSQAQYMYPFMKTNNWLLAYASTEGIQRALNGMSRRTTFRSKMEQATQELKQYHQAFEQEFLSFYPDLMAFARSWRIENNLE